MGPLRINSLPIGKNRQLAKEQVTAAGTKQFVFTIDAPDAFVIAYVSSTAGTVDVRCSQFIGELDEGKTELLQEFSPITAAEAGNLIVRKLGAQLQQLVVEVETDAAANYEIWVRGAAQDEASVRVLGSNAARATQVTINTGLAQPLIPTALTDRQGFVIKNNTQQPDVKVLYLGYQQSEATVANGYPIYPGEAFPADLQAGVTVWATADVDGIDVRISEGGS